jgi:enolase
MKRVMAKIVQIHARQILDSRGKPTVEAEVVCETSQGYVAGRASVPSGASAGRYEARELRDGDPAQYDGESVLKAVGHVRELIQPTLLGLDPADQQLIDQRLCELDGTADKSRLGANAVLAVSLACAQAAASASRRPLYHHLAILWSSLSPSSPGSGSAFFDHLSLPLPMVNMLSGGLHAGKKIEIQDVLVMPWGASTFSEALAWAVRIHRRLGAVLRERGYEWALVADEGGYGPNVESMETALEMVLEAMERAELRPGPDVALALDLAASHFFDGHTYQLKRLGWPSATADELLSVLRAWTSHFPIVSLEDVCADDDWDGWKKATVCFGGTHQLVGDDLFVTNLRRLQRGVHESIANAILIKLNQVGTLTETLQVMAFARQHGYRCIISARSGETEDTTIAHLAVATGAGQIKIGSVTRSERLAKYNELLRIEEALGPRATFSGPSIRAELAFV